MATAVAAEEAGQLVFQKSKKLQNECYVISVHDSAEAARIRFSAFDLESSQTHALSYSRSEFEALFQVDAELSKSASNEDRYSWVIERLELVSEPGGADKRLVLSQAPTEPALVPASPASKPTACLRRVPQREQLTYAERMRLRQQAEWSEARRDANIAMRRERNRKAFVAELNEKRKLEELNQASRRQRINEERAARREKAEMEKHLAKERTARYEENDRKREERIRVLQTERSARDKKAIQDIIESARGRQQAKDQRLEDARQRKQKADAAQVAEQAAKKEAQEQLDAKRESRIIERHERVKHNEKAYLAHRQQQIELLSREKADKERRKAAYLQDKAAQRARDFRLKQEKMEAWERLEDERTCNNMKMEQARNMLMLDHIESLRQKYNQDLLEAADRKTKALEERKSRESKEAAASAEENRRLQDVAQKREMKIANIEAARKEKNQKYFEQIRNQKTGEALRAKEQSEQADSAKEKSLEDREKERQARSEQDNAKAAAAAKREENIRRIERERDQKFAQKVQERKDQEKQKALDLEAKKTEKRLQEREAAEKRREEEAQRKKQAAKLEEQRLESINKKTLERDQREQDRWKGAVGEQEGKEAVAAAAEAEAPAPEAATAETAGDS